MSRKIQFHTFHLLFRLFSYLADKTGGWSLFVRPKLVIGALIVGMGVTACDRRMENKRPLKPFKQIGVLMQQTEEKPDSIHSVRKKSKQYVNRKGRTLVETEVDNVYCYDVVVNQDTSITNKYIPQLPIEQDGEYIVVDQMPVFHGGDKMLFEYIQQNLVYPEQLQNKGIEGMEICSFIVGEDSTISDIKIIRSLHPLLDTEAIRIIKSFPKWNPGKQNGITVPVRFTIPIRFTLPSKKK